MSKITMTVPDETLAVVGASPEEAGAELRMLAAVMLATKVSSQAGSCCSDNGLE
jgi:hypothetical protein